MAYAHRLPTHFGNLMENAALIARTWTEIEAFNEGRQPALRAQKYGKMAANPFIFLRGACHLFYPNLPATPLFLEAPLAWTCGDLHFENFGSYKGDDREVYFDINDFDESALAPASWDLVRLLTSLLSGADYLKLDQSEAREVAAHCLQAYREALSRGQALRVDKASAEGLVAELMEQLADRSRRKHLEKRTELRDDGSRKLKKDGEKIISLGKQDRGHDKARVEAFMAEYAKTQSDPAFYRVLDVAERVAGTGSLGLERYVILVEGKGSPDGNYLLDLKASRPSSLEPVLQRHGIAQAHWDHAAQRAVSIQDHMQAVDHAFLRAVLVEGKPYILRALQATEDRVELSEGQPLDQVARLANTLGRILAWDQLRAAGQSGAAAADALMAFARRDDWPEEMHRVTLYMHDLNQAQWAAFVAEWKKYRQD